MRITVVGIGYVGLITAGCLAEKGHFVTCLDVEKQKIESLQQGKSPIFEPGVEELLMRNKARLKYTTDYLAAFNNAEVIIVGVGTPDRFDGSANLSYVYAVAKQIAATVEQDCVVVIKSTVPVGTNDKVEQMIKNNLKHEVRIDVVSNPEFLSQGTAINDTLCANRIVIGVESEYAEQVMKSVYDSFKLPYVITNRKSSEMIKYAANDFLALKISYINEVANLCEIVGADIEDVATGMGMDPRIGGRFLRAGIGYGGSCFPKDTKALHWLANFNDYEIKTVKATIEVNENQKIKLVKKARKYFDSFNGLNIAVLGLTFKPGTDDLREAPSINNISILLDDGARIKAWDPVGVDNFQKKFPEQIIYCQTIEETLANTDVCFIFTEWPEIRNIELNKYKRLMKNPLVIDGRNCYSLTCASEAGITYESIGRRTVNCRAGENIF